MNVITTKQPRDYQVAGANFLKAHRRAILADEFGLGKTFQAVLAAETPVLIACPSHLLEQWKQEIQDVYPNANISLCAGSQFERLKSLVSFSDWTICNIEMLRSYPFPSDYYNTFIIDESHRLRGHVTIQKDKNGVNRKVPLQSAAAQDLAKTIPNVYLLTATPIKRESDDLFMQLAILDSKKFSSYNKFLQDFCVLSSNGFSTSVVGSRNKEELTKLLSNYMLKRSYKQVNMTRPETLTYNVALEPSKKWYKDYKNLKANYKLEDIKFDNAAEVMRTLQKLTFDLKIDYAKSILLDNPECIFYVYYRESAHMLSEALKIPYITGEQDASARVKIAKANRAVVATILSISEGVNLSHLNTVAFIETNQIPGDIDQALARVVRWNPSPRPVGVYNIRVKNSIDTTKDKIIARRTADIVSIIKAELLAD